MKCFNCSAEIAEGVQICPKCGANQGFTKELIFRAKNNDQAALTELYNKTYSGVYYTIKALIKDEDAALDILQDSYIKAFKSLDQLKEPEKFNAWIKQIAHNRSIDYLRKTKPLLFTEMESTDSDMPLEFEDTNTDNLPEEVIDKDETSRLIREILNDLPDEQRAVISMFYYEQMSVKEISQELGVSENTVKSRLNYGRKKVETKVLDLEKKGTKLYGLAPIPFFLLLLRSLASSPAPIPAARVKRIRTSVANELKKTASAAGNGTAGASAKGGFFASLKASLPLKIALGVLAVFIAAGGVAALVPDLNDTEGGSFGGGGSAGAGPGGQGSGAESATVVPSTTNPTEKPTEKPTEEPTEQGISDSEVFSLFSGEYEFMSGAGMWQTKMDIEPDGSFSGRYIDLDQGINVTRLSDFSGKFENAKKVNDYTYSFELSYIEYVNEPGTEEVQDGMTYIYTEAYGLDKGTSTFYAYTEDAPWDEMTDDYKSWLKIFNLDNNPSLGRKSLYSIEAHYGWAENTDNSNPASLLHQ